MHPCCILSMHWEEFMVNIRLIKVVSLMCAGFLFASACSSEKTEASNTASSPLGEFFGADLGFGLGGSSEDAIAKIIEQQKEAEESIAVCMKAEGFEYTPNTDTSMFEGFDLDYGSKEYTEKYGLGISTQAFSQEQVGPDLIGNEFNFDQTDFKAQQENDPNFKYAKSLSESEREAYEKALYGDYSAQDSAFEEIDFESLTEEEAQKLDEEMQDVFEDSEDQGCQSASNKAFGFETYDLLDKEFGDELENLYEKVEEDPRIKDKEKEILECATKKGLEFSGSKSGGIEEEIYKKFSKQVESIQSEIYKSGPESEGFFDEGFLNRGETVEEVGPNSTVVDGPFVEGGDSFAEGDDSFAETESPFVDQVFEEPELSDDQKEKLAVIQKEEIETALILFDCGGSQEENMDLFFEVMAEYETEFINDNKTRLTKIRDEISSKEE